MLATLVPSRCAEAWSGGDARLPAAVGVHEVEAWLFAVARRFEDDVAAVGRPRGFAVVALVLCEARDFARFDVDGEDVEDVALVACGKGDEIAFW